MSLAMNHAKEIGKKEAMDFLKSHKRFLLVGHEHPDGDDVGSICALHNVLVSMGKEADMLLPDPVPKVYTLVKASALVHHSKSLYTFLFCQSQCSQSVSCFS